jgi:hypothetical protein
MKLDGIATHNHPSSLIAVLSPKYLAACLSEGATEVRAVTRLGSVHTARFSDIRLDERRRITDFINRTTGRLNIIAQITIYVLIAIFTGLCWPWERQSLLTTCILTIIGTTIIASAILYIYNGFYILVIKHVFRRRVIFTRHRIGERPEFESGPSPRSSSEDMVES